MVAAQLTEPQEQEAKPWNPDLAPKQFEIMRACRERNGKRKFIFVNGCKFSGKSVGCENAVIDHAWNVDNAAICVLASSIGAGSDSGIWGELTETVIPQWIKGNFGFDWWKGEDGMAKKFGARMKGASKKLYCELLNKHGGKSYIELNSLKDERDVEKQFFNRYFTMIYWCEIQQSRLKDTFTALTGALRKPNFPEEDQILLCDGNPSDLGKKSWQYKQWFEFKNAKPEDLPEIERPLQDNLKLILVTLNDNPYLSADRKREIAAAYAHSPDLYSRYVLGEWTASAEDGLFADVFVPAVHLVGDPKDKDPEIILPTTECAELITGWDLGGVNPSAHILEQVFQPASDNSEKEVSAFRYIDELAFIGKDISIGEFTELFVEKMLFWEKIIGREINWKHWSDSNAFDHKEPISKKYQHQEVFSASEGKIKLKAVEKGRDSIKMRIRLWRRMLIQKRIIIATVMCPKLVEMNVAIKRGLVPESISSHSEHKHAFDSGSYPLVRECWDELQASVLTTRKLSHAKSDSGLVCVKF